MADEAEGPVEGRERRLARMIAALRRTDANPALVRAARATREMLPGDSRFGDELSTASGRPTEILARHLVEVGAVRESASKELGLSALQVWQAISQSTGRGQGAEEAAILFTDLVGFSEWALQAGDAAALELLREVARAVEPAIAEHDGRVVKRLGDGHMAVFASAEAAVAAAFDLHERVATISVAGHTPQLRAGVHLGHPRKLGGDYLGVDVNIAARVAAAADGGQVLVSSTALEALDGDAHEAKRRRRFRAKGAPRDLEVYSVQPRR
jgi:adenylate cyclase